MHPKARSEGVMVREVDGDFVVYDEHEGRAHELNASAAFVWRHCDGETSISELAAALTSETGLPADEEIVQLALAQLSKAGLLEGPQDAFTARVSRRQLIQRLGLAGSVTLMLPMVGTIVVPSPAMAQSPPTPPTPAPSGAPTAAPTDSPTAAPTP